MPVISPIIPNVMRTKVIPFILTALVLFLLAGSLTVGRPLGDSESSKREVTKVIISQTASALKMFRLRYKRYPTESEGLDYLVTNKHLESHPRDAWGNKLSYLVSGNTVTITSLGRDHKLGGGGFAQDLHESLPNF